MTDIAKEKCAKSDLGRKKDEWIIRIEKTKKTTPVNFTPDARDAKRGITNWFKLQF